MARPQAPCQWSWSRCVRRMQSRRSRARPLRSRSLRVRRGEMPASIRQIRFSPQARTKRTEQLPEEPLARMRRAAIGMAPALTRDPGSDWTREAYMGAEMPYRIDAEG